jgi:arylsulfatase A-like enzyme
MNHVRSLALVAAALAAVACDKPAPSSEPAPAATSAANGTPTAASTATAPAETPSPTPAAPAAGSVPEKLNVLLLTVDSLRADMPWAGYPREIAPNLTQLAKKSVVYTNAYAASSYTAKSVSSLLSGRYPSSLYRSAWFFAGFSDSNLFLTEVLQPAGVRTMGGHGHLYFDRGKNLNQGFDIWELAPGITFDSSTDKNVTSDKMTDMAIRMLSDEANTSKQFFMWFHYMDPHDQYVKHEGTPDFGKNNRDRYDSEVYFTDSHIGRLFDFAKEKDWWKRTAIIISADHGEAFGEHGMFKHAFELWEVLTRVPLVVYYPGVAPQVITERRSHIDVAPTILELMGHKVPESFVGHSLLPELRGQKPDNREPIVLDLPEDKNNPDRHAIISGDYKLIQKNYGANKLLFNLKNDPGEEQDLAKKEPEKLAEMVALYDKTWKGIEVIVPFGDIKLPSGKKANGPRDPQPKAP